jgi:branched-chain amino acid transport system permease protein
MNATRLKGAAFLLALLAAIAVPPYVQSSFVQHLLVIIGINVVVVLSLDMVLGHTGLISLGHAGFMGIGAYTCALMVVRLKLPFLAGLLGGMGSAALFGLVIGYPSLRLRGHYFVLVTFIVGIILTLLFTNLVSITNGPMGVPGIPPARIGFGEGFSIRFDTKLKFYYLVLALIVLLTYVKFRLFDSKMGRALLAIREDEELGRSVGINTHAYKVGVFVLSTAFTGAAGGLYAHYIRFIGPDSFTFLNSFYFFVMNLVGGAGTLAGPIIGPALLTVIDELSQLFQPAVARILFGVLLILIILYMPRGLMGLLARLFPSRS